MESWHAGLGRMLPTHPNIFVFIHAIKQQHACSKIIKVKAKIGDRPPKRKPKYKKLEEKIQKGFNKHVSGEITTMDLLSRVHCTACCQHN